MEKHSNADFADIREDKFASFPEATTYKKMQFYPDPCLLHITYKITYKQFFLNCSNHLRKQWDTHTHTHVNIINT